MTKGLEALKHLVACAKAGSSPDVCSDIDKLKQIIKKELRALEIYKALGFEIEDYNEDYNGALSVKFKRIILDDKEIDLLKEVLL